MTEEEIERMKALCRRIEFETDQKKFNELVEALNDLLAGNGGVPADFSTPPKKPDR